ncbi:MAG: hypothetical protein LAO22_17685 [Acidobacteriia bacterium]|nr:hypothetical protein [Terriglobia bacterium]
MITTAQAQTEMDTIASRIEKPVLSLCRTSQSEIGNQRQMPAVAFIRPTSSRFATAR